MRSNIERRDFLKIVSQGVIVSSGSSAASFSSSNVAIAFGNEAKSLSDNEIKEIVTKDILDRQFLVTGNLTPEIYRPTALFTDEIDTYKMDQWVKGTQKLFVGEQSQVRLVGDVLVTPQQVEFRFDEDLVFRIPFRPKVALTGRVVLTRDESGFITSYKEFWDQDVLTVLKSAKF